MFHYLWMLCTCLLFVGNVIAGPGAHGPNGEHLDAKTNQTQTQQNPKLESHSEEFELTAELEAHQLKVFVDRYLSNEPVLNAQLELESGDLKTLGQFEASSGSYIFTESKLIQALHQPGEHALVFTLLAGEESDLLEGSLNISKPSTTEATHHHTLNLWQISTGVLVVLVLLLLFRRQRGAV